MGSTPTPVELKKFIIEALALEDLTVEDIGDDTPLFEGGLGLDSIDTLELGIALRKKFNLKLGEDTSLRERLGTVKDLAAHLALVAQEA
jgi:acyl carrier protein